MRYLCLLIGLIWSLNSLAFDRTRHFGVAVKDASAKLLYVEENDSQKHPKDQYMMIKVKGFKIRKNEVGRVRIAIWDKIDNYGKEGVEPFRACSHWAKDAPSGEIIFKIAGFEKGKKYAFFAHFDKNNDGKVNRFLGIPTEPFIFSNAKFDGRTGPGLSREGLSAPKFENTLITYTSPGQILELSF